MMLNYFSEWTQFSNNYSIENLENAEIAIINVTSDSCICISRYLENQELELIKNELAKDHLVTKNELLNHSFHLKIVMNDESIAHLFVDNLNGHIIQYVAGGNSVTLQSKTDFGVLFSKMTSIKNYDCSKNSIHVNFSNIPLSEFIEILKIENPIPNGFYLMNTFGHADTNWIAKSDIGQMIDLISSEDKTYCIMQIISSNMPDLQDYSTLGGQIMNIIDSYRFNKPYPYFLTECTLTDEIRQQEILDWWSELNE